MRIYVFAMAAVLGAVLGFSKSISAQGIFTQQSSQQSSSVSFQGANVEAFAQPSIGFFALPTQQLFLAQQSPLLFTSGLGGYGASGLFINTGSRGFFGRSIGFRGGFGGLGVRRAGRRR